MFWFNVTCHCYSMRVFINAKLEHNGFDVNNNVMEISLDIKKNLYPIG